MTNGEAPPHPTFPDQFDRVRDAMRVQTGTLRAVASLYANGRSRIAVESRTKF